MTITTAESNDAAVSLCPAVQRFTGLLEEKPTDFDIAILSDKESETLEDAFVLLDGALGVNALDLPLLARDVREDYWACRNCDHDALWKVTKCLLLLCPDHATAWADRRRYLLRMNKRQQEALHKELAFSNLLMTKHTKA